MDFDYHNFFCRYLSGNESLKSLKDVSLKRLYIQRSGIYSDDYKSILLDKTIQEYKKASDFLRNRAVLDEESIFETARLLNLEQSDAYRKKQNWIGKTLKEASYVPPEHSEISSLMVDLFYDVNQFSTEQDAAEIYCKFLLIHPFLDGNGRIARLFYSTLTEQRGLNPVNVGLYAATQSQADFIIFVHSYASFLGKQNHLTEPEIEQAKNRVFSWLEHTYTESQTLITKTKNQVFERVSVIEMNNATHALLSFLINQPIINSRIIKVSNEFDFNTVNQLLQKGLLTFKKLRSANDDGIFECELFMNLHNQLESKILKGR